MGAFSIAKPLLNGSSATRFSFRAATILLYWFAVASLSFGQYASQQFHSQNPGGTLWPDSRVVFLGDGATAAFVSLGDRVVLASCAHGDPQGNPVRTGSRTQFIASDGSRQIATVVGVNKKDNLPTSYVDSALYEFSGRHPGKVFKIAKVSPQKGETVWIVGFPMGRFFSRRTTVLSDSGGTLWLAGSSIPGESGGAIVNQSGEWAGSLSAAMQDLDQNHRPTGPAYSICSSISSFMQLCSGGCGSCQGGFCPSGSCGSCGDGGCDSPYSNGYGSSVYIQRPTRPQPTNPGSQAATVDQLQALLDNQKTLNENMKSLSGNQKTIGDALINFQKNHQSSSGCTCSEKWASLEQWKNEISKKLDGLKDCKSCQCGDSSTKIELLTNQIAALNQEIIDLKERPNTPSAEKAPLTLEGIVTRVPK